MVEGISTRPESCPWEAAPPVSSSAEMGVGASVREREKEAYKPLILLVVDTTANSSKTFPIPLLNHIEHLTANLI